MLKSFPKISLQTFSIFLLLIYLASFSIRTDFSFDQDLGRHIKLGEIIVQSKDVPKINLFSYTYPNFPFINHHFLFEVLVYLGNQLLGIQALLVFKFLILLITTILILSINKSLFFLTLPLGFIFLHTFRERVELRPEIFSFLFTALTLFILEKFTQGKRKWIYFLPAVQLLWVNIHIYFPIGMILQGIYLSDSFFKKSLPQAKFIFLIFISSILVSLINPNGLNGLLYPLTVFGNYGYSIAENQNLFILESIGFTDPNFFFAKLSFVITILSIILAAVYQKLTLKNLMLSLLGLGLAIVHIRSFPYLVLITLPAILSTLNFIKVNTKLSYAVFLIFSLLLIIETYFYLSGDYYLYKDKGSKFELQAKTSAREAVDFVLANNLPQPIFNNFDIGSYIIYRAFPKYKVFVDGRPEAYPKEFFQKIYIPVQENPDKFKQLDKETEFKTIIFSHTDQTPWGKSFLINITKNPDWQTVYLDSFIIVLVKKEVVESQKLTALNLANITPKLYQFDNHLQPLRISLFLLNNQKLQPGKAFAQQSLKLFPESPIGNLIMASLVEQRGYFQKSKNPIWW